jgi:hypothetical protein
MQMFSARQTTGVVTYEKALAHVASGAICMLNLQILTSGGYRDVPEPPHH